MIINRLVNCNISIIFVRMRMFLLIMNDTVDILCLVSNEFVFEFWPKTEKYSNE